MPRKKFLKRAVLCAQGFHLFVATVLSKWYALRSTIVLHRLIVFSAFDLLNVLWASIQKKITIFLLNFVKMPTSRELVREYYFFLSIWSLIYIVILFLPMCCELFVIRFNVLNIWVRKGLVNDLLQDLDDITNLMKGTREPFLCFLVVKLESLF